MEIENERERWEMASSYPYPYQMNYDYDGTIKIPSAFRQHNSRILISFVRNRKKCVCEFVCEKKMMSAHLGLREKLKCELDSIAVMVVGEKARKFLHFSLRLISIMQVRRVSCTERLND